MHVFWSENLVLRLFSKKALKKRWNRFWKCPKMCEKYRKSRRQHEKEMERRRKLRDLILNVEELYTETEWARVLGCSQATVSRDLKKLRGTRWDPIEQRLRRSTEKLTALLDERRKKMSEFINSLSDSQLISMIAVVGKKRKKRSLRRAAIHASTK